jgi:hypothetical protein
MNARLERIIADNGFFEDDMPEIFVMVGDILELAAETLAENEPAAVRSIAQLKEVGSEIRDYESFLEGNHLKEAA